MILTDLYTFVHKAGTKMRVDCTKSTQSYLPFENLRNKQNSLFVYIGENTHTKAGTNCKSDLAITKVKHISSIYRPDVANTFAYGDMKDTADALLFVFHDFDIINGAITEGSVIEIFVARGYRKDRKNLYTLLVEGELNPEIEFLRQQAQKLPQNRNVI